MRFRDLDLATQLLVTRRGTAYFSQRLADIAASAMSMPTLLDGWSRKHLVAHVAYNAAALCRLLDWATSGVSAF
jgi:maleylpyruvate isomerase